MCKWGTLKPIHVIRRNHDDYPDGWHEIHVDACIAGYVQTMNDRGILTVGCCCSHGAGLPCVLVSIESIPRLDELGYAWVMYREGDCVQHDIPPENIEPYDG